MTLLQFNEPIVNGGGLEPAKTYYIEILALLLGAFILGYLLRLLLNSRYKSEIRDLEDENAKLRADLKASAANAVDVGPYETKINGLNADVSNLRSQLNSCRADLADCRAKKAEAPKVMAAAAPVTAAPKVTATPPASGKPDDLRKIEGIGPKIAELLNKDGIMTFAQLANASIERLNKILDDAGPNYAVHDPGTWPEQSALARDNRWDELGVLQDRLKGGKRV